MMRAQHGLNCSCYRPMSAIRHNAQPLSRRELRQREGETEKRKKGSWSTVASLLAFIIMGRHHKQTQPTAVCMLHRAGVLHKAEAVCWKAHTGSHIIIVRD